MSDNNKPSIIAICGSLRKESSNRKLMRVAIAGARDAGADVTELDLLDFPMPAYNEDDQNATGFPETAKKLRQLIKDADGVIYAVPEYNWTLPGGFKNIVDWLSRREDEGPFAQACFKDGFAALVAGSGGSGGAKNSIRVMRELMTSLGMHVIRDQFSLPGARNAFEPDGGMTDKKAQTQVEAVGAKLVETIVKLRD